MVLRFENTNGSVNGGVGVFSVSMFESLIALVCKKCSQYAGIFGVNPEMVPNVSAPVAVTA